MALSIRVHPGKSTQARTRAEKMAAKTGQPVSLLQQVTVHGGKYGTGKLRKAWTTYDTVYPSRSNTGRGRRHTRRSNPGGKVRTVVFYDVVDGSGYALSRSHYRKSEAQKALKRIKAEDARPPYTRVRKLKIVKRVESFPPGWEKQHNPTYTLRTVKPLLKRNPNRLTDVLVKRNGRVFKAKAKYDAKLGRVRIFANPRVAAKVNPDQHIYEVIVGNIGTVYSGNNYMQAMTKYSTYVKQSKSGSGRAGGESVTLMKAGEPIREHFGTQEEDW